jgi:hypothetical protein
MLTILFFMALQVTTPTEMACIGSVRSSNVPMELYVAGVKGEGTLTLASQGQIVYLNGPGVSALKTGSVQRVIRPEGRIKNPSSGEKMGTYYKDIGTIQIEAVQAASATARVLFSCQAMAIGDQVIPNSDYPAVEFNGDLSTELTPIPLNGVVSSILFGKDGLQELGHGQFCFIGLGGRDGVKAGDRLTVFRRHPPHDSANMATLGMGTNLAYPSARNYAYRHNMDRLLHERIVPPEILGDIVIVHAGDNVSTAKIINSLSEIHPGDLVVKR